MDSVEIIASQLNIRYGQAASVVELLDSGNSIPFIARYRKEQTGELNEEQIRQINAFLVKLRNLNDRRDTILKSIENQGVLTSVLRQQIDAADSLTELEDLYQPYKPKRRTRGTIAREKGLQSLADSIIQQASSGKALQEIASSYQSKEVPDMEAVLSGARDIVAENISITPDVRKRIRDKATKWGVLHCTKKQDSYDEKKVFERYYEFSLRVDQIKPHQILAINRGENLDILSVKIEIQERDWFPIIKQYFPPKKESPFFKELERAIYEAAERLLLPSIERDVRRELTRQAEEHAIQVFARNLHALLSQPPIVGQSVLGIDPGYRTGCKVAVVDETGKVMDTATIYPHTPVNKKTESLKKLSDLMSSYSVTLIAIGNGTASRETEIMIAELVSKSNGVKYTVVNESGASVYSASPLARSELPDLDVTIRGAVSIARRIQDPLAELVKIDPKSIGVGLYQHDINQKLLSDSLNSVVESVVNNVGIDVNTSSAALLTYISGIGPKLAIKIVEHRNENGPFKTREALQNVSGFGQKAFEQSAGFLRIRDGKNFLDNSAIHPESYKTAVKVLKMTGLTRSSSQQERETAIEALKNKSSINQLAHALNIGVPTLLDILEQLIHPGRDPREDLPAPVLRTDVLTVDDLRPGMVLNGSVRNVVDFGAFVDIGVKRDGLLHRSQIPFNERVEVGDIIKVEVTEVDVERERISLSWAGA